MLYPLASWNKERYPTPGIQGRLHIVKGVFLGLRQTCIICYSIQVNQNTVMIVNNIHCIDLCNTLLAYLSFSL